MSKHIRLVAFFVVCLTQAYNVASIGAGVPEYPLPSIYGEDAYTNVLDGETAILECKTRCSCRKSDVISTKWQENGRPVVVDRVVGMTKDGKLEIRNCTVGSTSKRVFRCVASVGNWSVIGIERRIRVIASLQDVLTIQPSKQTLPPGNSLVLKCALEPVLNSSKANVKWFKDGAQLSLGESSRARTLPGGFLLLRSVTTTDGGTYQCKIYSEEFQKEAVSNAVVFSVGGVEVEQKNLSFTYVPEEIEIVVGQPVSIPCAAKGSPPPFVSISREGNPHSVTVSSGIHFANFTVKRAKIGDAGKFICYAKSGEKKITQNIWLKVLAPPQLTANLGNWKLTPSGFPLSILCPTRGNPQPHITWYKDGANIESSDRVELNYDGDLVIKSVKQEDVGIYQCIARNKVGSVSHSTFVFIEQTLRPPVNVMATAISATAVNVSWQPNPINNNNAVLAHIVLYEYFTSGTNRAKKETVVGDLSATSVKLMHLLGGTKYYVYLSTYGKNGQKSGNSRIVEVKTLENVPGISPAPINVVNLGNKTIRVLWTAIPTKNANGKITEYKVMYGLAGLSRTTIYVPAGNTQIDIMDLELGELYTIEVAAATSAGYGMSAKSTIKIGDPEIADENGPPMELESINSTALQINWTPRKSNYITGFILTCVPTIASDYWHEVRIIKLKPDRRSHILDNLNPDKNYRIELRIVSGPVISKSSVTVHSIDETTAVPGGLQSLKVSKPRDLECAVKGNASIYLSWVAPMHFEDVDHYTVNIEQGGREIEKYKTFHTRNLRYLLENLTRGTWYYVRVSAVPKQHRVDELARQFKRKLTLPHYESKMTACKTVEAKPGPPQHVFCNVSQNAHSARVLWHPPEYPYGLVTKYIIKYKHITRKIETKWITGSVTMKPNKRGFPLEYVLDVDYYKKYRIEIIAVNSAGEGRPAIIESCAMRRTPVVPTDIVNVNSHSNSNELMSHDTRLGIIIGCSIASLFILTFVVVFIWKNPFRVKSAECQRNDSSKTNKSNLQNDDFLYLQRMAELQNNASFTGTECDSKCSNGSKNSHGRQVGENGGGASQPLMPKYQTAIELTGGSSGQPVCTCTCLLHGRLRGQPFCPRQPGDFPAAPAGSDSSGGDGGTKNRKSMQSTSSSNATEDVDSAESADSRTQMLRNSPEAAPHSSKDQTVPSVKVLQLTKKETTFQV